MSLNEEKPVKFWGIILFLIFISILIPFGLEKLVFQNHIQSTLSNSEWSGFLGSFLGGIIGGGATLYTIYITTKETRRIEKENSKRLNEQIQNEEDIRIRKEKIIHRSFLGIDEINNLGFRLEGYKNHLNKDVRILETDNFKSLENYVKVNGLQNEKLNYMKISNSSENIAFECRINFEIKEIQNNKVMTFKNTIPRIEKNQEYFILAQCQEFILCEQLLTKMEIQYKTVVGEKIKYMYSVDNINGVNSCTEKYYYHANGGYHEFISVNNNPVSWIYVNHNRTI